MEESIIEKSLKELERRFKDKPLQFTVESALVDELVRILREESGHPEIEVEGNYEDFDYTNYKTPYLENMQEKREISPILPEVNVGDRGENTRIDIAILSKENEPVEVEIKKGSKYFHKKDIKHAIEFKYVKNDNLLASRNNDGTFPHTSGDIKKLRKNAPNSETRWMVVASNKDIFKKEEPDEEVEKTRKREKKMRSFCEEDPEVKLREFHLGKRR